MPKNKWYHKPLWANLIPQVLYLIIWVIITAYTQYNIHSSINKVSPETPDKVDINIDINKEQEKAGQIPKLPITLSDGKGNYLFIREPIGHEKYYEFPVVLIDKDGAYRIDKYYFSEKYAGKLVYFEKGE